MSIHVREQIEASFAALPADEQESVIRHGVALRLAELRQRLFLAESKLRHFTDQHGISLEALEEQGLPDDAGVEWHEDYVMWRHWAQAAEKSRRDVQALEEIARHGLT